MPRAVGSFEWDTRSGGAQWRCSRNGRIKWQWAAMGGGACMSSMELRWSATDLAIASASRVESFALSDASAAPTRSITSVRDNCIISVSLTSRPSFSSSFAQSAAPASLRGNRWGAATYGADRPHMIAATKPTEAKPFMPRARASRRHRRTRARKPTHTNACACAHSVPRPTGMHGMPPTCPAQPSCWRPRS